MLFLHCPRIVPVFYMKIKPQAIYILNTKLLTYGSGNMPLN